MKPRIGITTTPRTHEDRLLEEIDRANVTAIVLAGGIPFILPVLDPAEAGEVISCLDGLLLSGGGDVDPARYGRVAAPEVQGVDAQRDVWELALVRAALTHGVPMLGICRGNQVINVAAGGTLVQHLPDVTELEHSLRERSATPVHGVRVLEGSRLRSVIGIDVLAVNSLHHQAIEAVGVGLVPPGWADDGTIEAVEGMDGDRVLGVQWHPELLPTEPGHVALFAWLLAEARRPQALPATAASSETEAAEAAAQATPVLAVEAA